MEPATTVSAGGTTRRVPTGLGPGPPVPHVHIHGHGHRIVDGETEVRVPGPGVTHLGIQDADGSRTLVAADLASGQVDTLAPRAPAVGA